MNLKYEKSSCILSGFIYYYPGKTTCFQIAALFLLFTYFPITYAQEWVYPGWEETAENRQLAENKLNEFNQRLLNASSATALLTAWCQEHHFAKGKKVKIIALRDRAIIKKADNAVLATLQVNNPTDISYRRVKLICNNSIFSEADNWYVRSRLTDKMNQQLDNSDIPFGIVVKPLHFTRHNKAVTILWHPLKERVAVQRSSGKYISPPEYLLQHQTVLYNAKKQPISLVIESYRNDAFRFSLK